MSQLENTLPSLADVEAKLADNGASARQLEEILWLSDFAQTQGLKTFAAIAKEIGVSESQVSLVLRGKYSAGLDGFADTIAQFRALWKERQDLGPVVFIPQLSVVKRLTQFADLVRATRQIGIVWGKNQTGKSSALEYYAGQNKLTAFATLPAGGACKPAMKDLALARGGIPVRKSHEELRERILRAFNPQWLVIADEFHQAFKGRTLKTVTIDRFREVRDRCKCGLLICGTDLIVDMMEDELFRDMLGQIGNRGVLRMHIPTAPEPEDIRLLSAAYGFPGEPSGSAAKWVREIAHENGISKLSAFFVVARMLASKSKARLTWRHFETARATLASWEKGDFHAGERKPKQLVSGEAAQLEDAA